MVGRRSSAVGTVTVRLLCFVKNAEQDEGKLRWAGLRDQRLAVLAGVLKRRPLAVFLRVQRLQSKDQQRVRVAAELAAFEALVKNRLERALYRSPIGLGLDAL